MLLVLLVPREAVRAELAVAADGEDRKGKEWGRSRPLKKRWSAGEFLLGSVEGESGVREPNSKSSEEDGEDEECAGVLGKEKAVAEASSEAFLRRVSMEEGGEELSGCMKGER
ncbi:hypothetical protein TIFTF001_023608 [Ficus carica]|uniref:Uncharacterized protein n=1 Tax=Ficus carica TaxID=3494 RepID=A0AA88B063_FICCA|nr:hypothetical protein TIFTF001_023608 [Ficus carica]